MIYLRDLRDNIRLEYEKIIRKERPDLVKYIDDPDQCVDIIIGEGFYKADDFKPAG